MHGHNQAEFLAGISGFLGAYYLSLSLMNAVATFYLWRKDGGAPLFRAGGFQVKSMHLWLAISLLFLLMSPLAFSGSEELMGPVCLPESIKSIIDTLMGPVLYTVGSLVGMAFFFVLRRFFVKPVVAWLLLNLSLLLMGMSMTDPDFAAIVMKPDNVPIVGLVYLLGFFTWLSAYRAVENDDRIARGEPTLEHENNEKILVWPDLVYTELICMVALTAFLLLWAIGLQAPLEEPASSVKTPNPSKAPWYFLGLQEMLVYYDPWMAGVVLPSVIVFGLMAIPFIDFNKKGNGYYTINERKFAYLTFQFGFLVLWVTLIVMGTFLRGPNWNFFGPYETWDAHKVEALNNIDLSEYFWVFGLNMPQPKAPDGSGVGATLAYILLREFPGILMFAFYFVALPPLMVLYSKFFREMFVKMGFLRYMVLANLLLFMALLPLKMAFRWVFNLKYFIAIPEFFLNF